MTDPMRDPSLAAAAADVQTVTPDGTPVARTIAGVRTHAPVVHVDHRGRVFELYPGQDAYWQDPIVYCYAWTIRPGMVKGWGLHERKMDRYTLLAGEGIVFLYDARTDSPTHGLVQRIPLVESGIRQLSIPPGVWHLTMNVGEREFVAVNHPTTTYNHVRPDRYLLPWDTDAIPVRLRDFFPVQSLGAHGDPCRHP